MSLTELAKDIYAKLDSIQSVIGFILEKTKLIPDRLPPVEKMVIPKIIENKIFDDINAETEELPQDA
jgi:hypothetical protein